MAYSASELTTNFNAEAGDVAGLATDSQKILWFNEGQARLTRFCPSFLDISWLAGDRALTLPSGFVQLDKIVYDVSVVAQDWRVYGSQLVIDYPLGAGTDGSARLFYWSEWPKIDVSSLPVSSAIASALDVVGPVTVAGADGVTVTVSGTYSGVTVNFEASDDAGVTWYAVGALSLATGVLASTVVLAADAAVVYQVPLAGLTQFRLRASAWTSGSAVVDVQPVGNGVVGSSLSAIADVACLYYALHRFYRLLASNRSYYKRYATLQGANSVSMGELQAEADRYYQDFIDARADMEPLPVAAFYPKA